MGLHDKEHPLICLYKDTIKKNFPIILIFGREPNNEVPFYNEIGLYDFDEKPKTGFWNISYKLVGDLHNLSVKELKDKCKSKESSILAYTDCSPCPIPSNISNYRKKKIRQNIPTNEIENHIEDIFSKEIINRVKLIILSGVSGEDFRKSVDLIKNKCEERKIKSTEVLFFHGNNYPKIYQKIKSDNDAKSIIKEIFNKWETD